MFVKLQQLLVYQSIRPSCKRYNENLNFYNIILSQPLRNQDEFAAAMFALIQNAQNLTSFLRLVEDSWVAYLHPQIKWHWN